MATRNEGSLSYPYAVRMGAGRQVERDRAVVVHELEAVRRAFAGDPERQARILSALRRSGVGSTAWSAVFISTVFKLGGYGPSEFEGAAAHSLYMRSALRSVADANAGYGQLPCDPAWVKPRVGDLVCFSRVANVKTFADVLARFEASRLPNQGLGAADDRYRFDSHCDLVVHTAAARTQIDTVGGNLSDTVKKSPRPTQAGLLTAPASEAARGTGWLMVLVLTRQVVARCPVRQGCGKRYRRVRDVVG